MRYLLCDWGVVGFQVEINRKFIPAKSFNLELPVNGRLMLDETSQTLLSSLPLCVLTTT